MDLVSCDVCRKTFRREDITTISIKGMYNEEGLFDICDKCKDKLTNLLKW